MSLMEFEDKRLLETARRLREFASDGRSGIQVVEIDDGKGKIVAVFTEEPGRENDFNCADVRTGQAHILWGETKVRPLRAKFIIEGEELKR